MDVKPGRHFLQIPGPTNVPDRILRAIAQPTIDHRGPAFALLGREVLDGLQRVFQTSGHVVIYPSSGTGAWEAALVNTLSAGDRVLMFETGHFAALWRDMAARLGLQVDFVPGDWRHGVDPALVEQKLADDRGGGIKAVAVVHNETSTGVTSRVPDVRRAMDAARHPALLLVDAVSSLGSIDYRHDEWRADVTVSSSQKGMMLPPGLGFNAISDKALAASSSARLPRSYWDWAPMITNNAAGFFTTTPATNLLYGLREAIQMLMDEGPRRTCLRGTSGLPKRPVARSRRGASRSCASQPEEYSRSLTAVVMPAGDDADAFRQTVLDRFDMSLGTGLGKLKGTIFRIGHLGDFNDLMLAGHARRRRMGLALSGVPFKRGGVTAALEYLALEAGHLAASGNRVIG